MEGSSPTDAFTALLPDCYLQPTSLSPPDNSSSTSSTVMLLSKIPAFQVSQGSPLFIHPGGNALLHFLFHAPGTGSSIPFFALQLTCRKRLPRNCTTAVGGSTRSFGSGLPRSPRYPQIRPPALPQMKRAPGRLSGASICFSIRLPGARYLLLVFLTSIYLFCHCNFLGQEGMGAVLRSARGAGCFQFQESACYNCVLIPNKRN